MASTKTFRVAYSITLRGFMLTTGTDRDSVRRAVIADGEFPDLEYSSTHEMTDWDVTSVHEVAADGSLVLTERDL